MNPLSHSVHLAEYYRPDAEGSISVINQTPPLASSPDALVPRTCTHCPRPERHGDDQDKTCSGADRREVNRRL